jgi:putative transposase
MKQTGKHARMPRRPRFWIRDVPLHILQRGNNRAACFYAEEDYRFYLHWLQLNAEHYGCAIHAYVLMTNHVHLMLTPKERDSASKLMQSLGRRYVQYVNRVHRRSGTLWEGRFRASPVEAESYLLICSRYIELNPVRAAVVKDPADYIWSSYRHHALGAPDRVVTEHALFNALGATPAERAVAYRALFRTELDEREVNAIRTAVNHGGILSSDRFIERVSKIAGIRKTTRPQDKKRPD